jgi:hypothetical protein
VGSHIVAADLNGDGAIDIVTSGAHGTFIFWGTKTSGSSAAAGSH